MKKYHILQFTPYFPPHTWGLEAFAQEWSMQYTSFGGKVTNLTSTIDQTVIQDYYDEKWYRVWLLPSFDIIPGYPIPKFWSAKFWFILAKIRASRPDFIHTHTRFFIQTFLGAILARIWWIKWVHIEHWSGLVQGLVWWKRLISNMYDFTIGRLVFRHADAVVCISEACADFVRRYTSRKLHVIYRGIELDYNKMIRDDTSNLETIKFGFVWRLVALKGVDVLLRALASFEQKIAQDWRLEIVGDGQDRQSLEILAMELNLQEKVYFLGSQDREWVLYHFLPSIDIFVNPSFQEGLPTTVLEALLAKCVVVASDVGGTKEISDACDLLLLKPGNVDDLIKMLVHSVCLLSKKWSSYVQVKSKFSVDSCLSSYIVLRQDILGSI